MTGDPRAELRAATEKALTPSPAGSWTVAFQSLATAPVVLSLLEDLDAEVAWRIRVEAVAAGLRAELAAAHDEAQQWRSATEAAAVFEDAWQASEAQLADAHRTLDDFAQHGLRFDLNPTMDCSSIGALYVAFTRYLERADADVRARASRPSSPDTTEATG